MPDYTNGKIYKIVNDELNLTYYGSTTTPLYKRLYLHKTAAYKKKCTSHKLFESGNVDIVLVENISCNNKEELHRKERYYIENNECVNRNIPTRTRTEYYQDNLEYFKQYYQKNIQHYKEYYDTHKEEISGKRKEQYHNNKEHRLKYQEEYRKANKERINQYQKEHYQKHKERLRKYQRQYYQKNKK